MNQIFIPETTKMKLYNTRRMKMNHLREIDEQFRCLHRALVEEYEADFRDWNEQIEASKTYSERT